MHVGGGCGARAVSARAVGAVRGGEGSEGCEGGEGGEGGGGGWCGWSCWGSNRTLFSLLFFVSSEYGSMWAVGAVGVLEERNACGRWVWGEGGRGR